MQLVKPLSAAGIEKIHAASLDILENTGVRIEHEGLLKRLAGAGARVNGANGTVRFPAKLVCELLQQIPPRYTICGIDGSETVVENGCRHWTGESVYPMFIDYDTGLPRKPRLRDAHRHNIVCQKLERIKMIYRLETPLEEDEDLTLSLESLQDYVLNNGKHMFMFGTSPELLEHYLAIARIIGETQGIPVGKLITASCPISSPLKLPHFYADFLLRCCEAGMVICGTVCPVAGATAPFSQAGLLLQANAENLFVAAVSQIVRPGNPFLYLAGGVVMDMRTGRSKYYSMDRALFRSGVGQMAAFYNLPLILAGGGSMTWRLDMQGAAESFAGVLSSYAAKPAFIGALGHCYNALAISPELLLIHAAYFDVAEFLDRGITLDDRHLGLESIRRAGPGGDFLMDDLTLQTLREQEFFEHELFDLSGSDDGQSMLDRAHERVDAMTAEFESPLPHGLHEKLTRYFHGLPNSTSPRSG